MIAAAILDECVQVCVGRGGRRGAVKAVYSAPYGHAEAPLWGDAAAALWSTYDLPRRRIALILPRQAAITKVLTLPRMGHKQTLEAIRWELQGEEELVTDFLPLETEGKRRRILAAACRRTVLEGVLESLSRLGLEPGRISVPVESLLKLLPTYPQMQDETVLWLVFDGGAVQSFLAERGAYRYCGSARVFAPAGTAEFAAEVEGIVSGLMQFYASERRTAPITHLYYAGCTEEGFSPCRGAVAALGLTAQPLPECPRLTLPQGEDLGKWVYCAGSFL